MLDAAANLFNKPTVFAILKITILLVLQHQLNVNPLRVLWLILFLSKVNY